MSEDEAQISAKAAQFLDALEWLCVSHGVSLSVSGYESLEIWDWDGTGNALQCDSVIDWTGINNETRQ